MPWRALCPTSTARCREGDSRRDMRTRQRATCPLVRVGVWFGASNPPGSGPPHPVRPCWAHPAPPRRSKARPQVTSTNAHQMSEVIGTRDAWLQGHQRRRSRASKSSSLRSETRGQLTHRSLLTSGLPRPRRKGSAQSRHWSYRTTSVENCAEDWWTVSVITGSRLTPGKRSI